MKTGPKYKIARRLGVPIFEKTQTPQFALSLARKEKSRTRRYSKPKSEYGLQLIEKQKARFTYGLSEKQFRIYVDKALASSEPIQRLFTLLESRLDNVLYRAGFSKTRAQARQAASHGHILVNGRRVTIPSILLKEGDTVSVRKESASSALWNELDERMKSVSTPAWIKLDQDKKEAVIQGGSSYVPAEHLFDLGVVIEFYSR